MAIIEIERGNMSTFRRLSLANAKFFDSTYSDTNDELLSDFISNHGAYSNILISEATFEKLSELIKDEYYISLAVANAKFAIPPLERMFFCFEWKHTTKDLLIFVTLILKRTEGGLCVSSAFHVKR